MSDIRNPISVRFYRLFHATTDAGWRGVPGVIPNHLIIFVTKGKLILHLQGAPSQSIPEGKCLAIPAGTHRHALCDVDSQSYRLRFNGDCPLDALVKRTPSVVVSLLATVQRLAMMPEPHSETLDHLLAAVLSELQRPTAAWMAGLDDSQQQGLESWLDLAMAGHSNVNEGARSLGISADHFARLFKRQFGVSPKRYLMDQRFQRAREMLSEEDLGIGEVAKQLGMNDLSLFCLQFRQRFGITPLAYRHQILSS